MSSGAQVQRGRLRQPGPLVSTPIRAKVPSPKVPAPMPDRHPTEALRMATGDRGTARARPPAPATMHLSVLQKHPIFGEIGEERIKQLCAFAAVSQVKAGITIVTKRDDG